MKSPTQRKHEGAERSENETTTFQRGDVVRDRLGRTHIVLEHDAVCSAVYVYGGGHFHPTKLWLARRA